MARFFDDGPQLDKHLLSQNWKSDSEDPDGDCDPRFRDGPLPLNCTLRDQSEDGNAPIDKQPTPRRRSYHDMRKEQFEADAAKLQQMIDQEARSTEVQEWRDGESASWVNIETLDHDQDVLWVIRWAFDKALFMHGDKPDTIQNWVASALAIVTNVRQTDAKRSNSILLRDAQRYLWGRAGVPIHAADSLLPAGVYETFAEPGADAYDTGKWIAQGYDGAFGAHTVQSTEYPASPSGGTFWFSLGLRHYLLWDKNHLADKDLLVPEITNVWEMRFLQYSSGFIPTGQYPRGSVPAGGRYAPP